MRKALALARRGGRAVRPNPRVGAVLLKNSRILASGYHSRFGEAHAEAKVLKKAGNRAGGTTLYVTLEPCSTSGKTPPCVSKIIQQGVSRVVIGCLDCNPDNRDRAVRILRKAGISVTVGVLKSECLELNRDFFTWITLKRPYSMLKLAVSLDGKIATHTGQARWISSISSRKFSHFLRSRADAILVGTNTVLFDDPRLNVRMGYQHPHLKKIVLDSHGKIPLSSRVFQKGSVNDTIVVTTPRCPRKRMISVIQRGGRWLKIPAQQGRVNLKILFKRLAREGIMRLLIEGGGTIAASVLEEDLVDEIHFFIAPVIIGGLKAPPAVGGKGVKKIQDAYRLIDLKVSRLGPDIHVWGRLDRQVKNKKLLIPEGEG